MLYSASKQVIMAGKLILFFLLNFGALALGSFLMNNGPNSDWYLNLNKAPWTPPGWVFGFAWSTIMLFFTLYMAFSLKLTEDRNLLIYLFVIQWILNVAWSPLFFRYQVVLTALIVIILLTIVVGWFLFSQYKSMGIKSLFILPYFIWLFVAISLNAYVLVKN